jgi:UDP-3-O-[3-hydroxymyristoyl] glucosamine N-acyltransferase
MTTAKEILDYLREAGPAIVQPAEPPQLENTEITGVTTDLSARAGDLSWISPRNASRFPERLLAFNGTILIGPPVGVISGFDKSQAYVECPDPKAAFTSVVDTFFAHLSVTSWPAADRTDIAADARIGARVSLAAGVVIGGNVTIGDDVTVGPNTCIANAQIAAGVKVGANCSIGLAGFGYAKDANGALSRFPHLGRVVIEAGAEIGSNTCIDRGSLGETVVGEGCKIDNLVHIAHNVVLGRNVVVIANAMIGGSTTIEAQSWVAPSVSVIDGVTIGADAVLGLGAVVLKTVPGGAVFVGNPARPLERRPAE